MTLSLVDSADCSLSPAGVGMLAMHRDEGGIATHHLSHKHRQLSPSCFVVRHSLQETMDRQAGEQLFLFLVFFWIIS